MKEKISGIWPEDGVKTFGNLSPIRRTRYEESTKSPKSAKFKTVDDSPRKGKGRMSHGTL